ncbi:MAG: hypothetical protein JO151_19960 [Verrucomicrobia bacterium]|nr:hypothetical protein [Verrucomicrobiota bacterium]
MGGKAIIRGLVAALEGLPKQQFQATWIGWPAILRAAGLQSKIGFFLHYDGTLREIEREPGAAAPTGAKVNYRVIRYSGSEACVAATGL